MIVEFDSKMDAKRATIDSDDYKRLDKQTVRTQLDNLSELVQADLYSIDEVTLRREHGEREATIIDREIRRGREGMYTRSYAECATYHTSPAKLRRGGMNVFRVREDSLQIFEQFLDVVSDTYSLTQSKEDFEATVSEFVSEVEAEIESLEDEIDELRDKQDTPSYREFFDLDE